jgi:hypothetical protein
METLFQGPVPAASGRAGVAEPARETGLRALTPARPASVLVPALAWWVLTALAARLAVPPVPGALPWLVAGAFASVVVLATYAARALAERRASRPFAHAAGALGALVVGCVAKALVPSLIDAPVVLLTAAVAAGTLPLAAD